MRKYLTNKNLLFGILLLAFLLRFWGAGSRDLSGDEGVDNGSRVWIVWLLYSCGGKAKAIIAEGTGVEPVSPYGH